NDPVIQKQNFGPGGGGVIFVGFSSTEMSRAQISDYLQRVVNPIFSTVEGVASVNIMGSPVFAMRLWLDPDRMAARGITGADIQDAILANNVQSAPGQAKSYYTLTNVTANTGLEDIDQFRNMVVKSVKGVLVRMRDVATVDLD